MSLQYFLEKKKNVAERKTRFSLLLVHLGQTIFYIFMCVSVLFTADILCGGTLTLLYFKITAKYFHLFQAFEFTEV